MISKIFLASDIHIRPYKRHKEYELVFKRLLKFIQENKDENSVICLGGDLVHNKTDISPELIQITSKFLKSCADICPTILILGNHDGLINNSNRLDALTPIVESLNHPNLHFWKDSGVYRLNGVAFSVYSIFDSPDNWVRAKDIRAKNKIALFHGPVIDPLNPPPHLATGSRTVTTDYFDDFDFVLLGDLHPPNADVDGTGRMIYPGSLICQGFGEQPLDHGILIWDVEKRTSEFVEIENDFCYFTLNVINNQYQIPRKLTKKVRLRIKHENSSAEIVNQAIEEFGKKFTVIESIKVKVREQEQNFGNFFELGNSRNVSYQNQIIEEYLNKQGIEKELIESVKEINLATNQTINLTNQVHRNVNWIPKKLEFSNMFSYGENNELDFTNFDGIYGIMAGNFQGKSSLLDILCFSLYDKATRASKAIHVLNNTKDWFKCKFSFEFNNQDYFIERFGQKNEKTGNVRVDVKFWTIDEDGNEKLLNGEDRDKTNYAIREYLGTYDDFVMTVLSTQYDNQSFVEKSQRERKDLLYKFLDISIYDELFKLTKDVTKEQQVLIREFEKENLYDKLSALNSKTTWNETRLEELNVQAVDLKNQIKSANEALFNLSKNLQTVDVQIDIEKIKLERELLTNQLQAIVEQIKTETLEHKKNISTKDELTKQLSDIDIDAFVRDKSLDDKFKIVVSKLNDENRLSHQLEMSIQKHEEQVNKLKSHEYDPNCEFCCKNQFVIDAQESVKKLPDLKSDLLMIMSNVSAFESEQFQLQLELNKRKQQLETISQLAAISNKVDVGEERIKSLKYQGSNIREKIKKLDSDEKKFNDSEQTILNNVKIEREIENVKSELSKLEINDEKIQKETRTVFSNLTSSKKESQQIQSKILQYNELIKNNRAYELYTQAISRDGVPYLILEKVLPLIEHEVNEILNQVVNFTVRLESTEEKYIHAYIDYGNNQTWPVELTSGMERFILSLAFRSALTETTSLPKPLFLAIDEGFGVLDADNLLGLGKLFDFLKTRYNYLLIISHIDQMRDLVEKKINVEKINGYSTIKVQEN